MPVASTAFRTGATFLNWVCSGPTRRALDDDEAALVAALAGGPRTPGELAAVVGWRPAAVAAALDELVRAGWVRPAGDAYAAVDD